MLLYRFEIDFEGGTLPTVNEAELRLGAMRSIGDIRVKVSEREL